MKKLILILISTCSMLITHAQKFYTKNGSISFFSTTSMENIKADNSQVMCVLNVPVGEIQFSVLIKSFHFQKSLMEEHFNENYMESDKFPKSTFKGGIADFSKYDLSKNGSYTVAVSGNLTIHGVTKKVVTNGTLQVNTGKITVQAKFPVRLADYNITIPKLVKDNIAENVDITVNCTLDQKM
ncbi:MAG: YceI family protein [Bacteroidetes bacterium]|nr:YceI family protein [Bacteroidota bacterium]